MRVCVLDFSLAGDVESASTLMLCRERQEQSVLDVFSRLVFEVRVDHAMKGTMVYDSRGLLFERLSIRVSQPCGVADWSIYIMLPSQVLFTSRVITLLLLSL
jgi:hypothetical protein